MFLPITSIYASVLCLLYIALSNMVSAERGKSGISIFHEGNETLALRIRRHGNFAEYVPFALLLFALVEIQGAHYLFLHVAGLVLIVSRVLHAVFLKADDPKNVMRIVGGILTQLVMLLLAGWLVFRGVQS